MSTTRAVADAALDELAELASRWTGFSRDAVHRASLGQRLRQFVAAGGDLDSLRARARRGERAAIDVLAEAISVGETYFFRQGEHFEWLGRNLAFDAILARRGRIRAWSAGCATGEEAWSIASFVRAHASHDVPVEVLGTDLLERHVAAARIGIYRRWSARTDAKYPVVHEDAAGQLVVMRHLRPLVSFARHNLLDPAPASFGTFDLVLCRNVLVYLHADAARHVCEQLRTALAPGGLVVFAPADLVSPPAGLASVGPPELCIFGHAPAQKPDARPASSSTSSARRTKPRTLPPPQPSRPPTPRPRKSSGAMRAVARPRSSSSALRAVSAADVARAAHASSAPPPATPAVALHLKALASIDRGDRRTAAKLLGELELSAPGYLPGLLECALFHQRAGDRAKAERLMRTLLTRIDGLPQDMRVPGPQEMPVAFYATSARAFFEGKGRA